MPARIYALAKELNIDSKDLVELVKKAGITGKGSALASLTDEETQRLRDHIAGSSAPAAKKTAAPAPAAAAAPAAPLRPERVPLTSRIGRGAANRNIVIPKQTAPSTPAAASPSESSSGLASRTSAKATPAPEKAPPAEVKEPVAPVAKQTPPEAPPEPAKKPEPKAPAAQAPSRPAQPQRPTLPSMTNAPMAPLRRDPHTGNLGSGRMRSLDRPSSGGGDNRRSGDANKPPRRREPVINLAALPDAPQAPVSRASNEPPAQKPDIKLSKDVIAGHKQGLKAPLEQLAADENEKKARANKRAGAATGAGGLSGFTGDRAGRRKGPGEVEEEDKPRRGKGIAGMASARADRGRGGKRRDQAPELDRSGRETPIRRRTLNRRGPNTAAPRKELANRFPNRGNDRDGT